MSERALLFISMLGGLLLSGGVAAAQQHRREAPATLDCTVLDCEAVLPGAAAFRRDEGAAYAVAIDPAGETVGWVALSTDVVDVVAYSGKPLVTLVGLSTEGMITGARVLHHSEPILLVGIPERALFDFVDFYEGKAASARVVVGHAQDDESISVDVISGATVTALAQNRTILDTARMVGVAVGVIDASQLVPGHFESEELPWTWQRMRDEDVFGRLRVSEADMGVGEANRAFVDLWYTIADAPQVGRALLGDNTYEHSMGLLEPGQHLFVVFGNGSNSFKGSAFVRGGLFDRVRIEQGLTEIMFRDTDYENLSRLAADDAPRFREGAIFITRGGSLDPGAEYELVFLGSRYDGRGAFSREFREFKSSHRLPRSVYVLDGPEPEPMWVQAWRNNVVEASVLAIYLLFVIGVFTFRRYTTRNQVVLRRLHLGVMLFGFVGVGLVMGAQPSVTQLLTLADSIVHEWRWDLFASEPLVFLLWIFIFVVSLIWGRGVFCGWVCPYGVMTELLHKLARKVRVPEWELPARVHNVARYLRYGVLIGLVPIFLWNSVLGEQLAEVEPFKSTFYVPLWTRHWGFGLWWAFLALWSVFTWRPFCRYICPLGGGLALFNSFRFSGPRRRSFCESCSICEKGCEPLAIRKDGTIDPRECLSCMDCEAVYRDEEKCPPLVGIERLLVKKSAGELDARQESKLVVLREDAKDV